MAAIETRGTTILLLLILPLLGAGVRPVEHSAPPVSQVRIVSEVSLPQALLSAQDVRWASDDSVYLALVRQGVAEMSLKPGGKFHEVFPGASKLGGLPFTLFVASSARYVAAAGPAYSLVWQRRGTGSREDGDFEAIKAIDVREDRLLVVGARRDDKGTYSPDGAVAWTGALDKKLSDLKPVLYDSAGPGAQNLTSCISMLISGARFLPDGGVLIAPGFQPGISRYDANGKLVQTWDTGALGIDTDCASITPEQRPKIAADAALSHQWINRRTTIDSVLPLATAPALVVRRVEKGLAHWDLVLLQKHGEIERSPIPIEADGDLFHLSGDVRGSRVLLLLRQKNPKNLGLSQSRLFLAALAQPVLSRKE